MTARWPWWRHSGRRGGGNGLQQVNLNLLRRLIENQVRFTVVGGMAAVLHGSSIVTHDLDVCAPLDDENIPRILAALRGINPRFRMRPDKPPVPDDPARLRGFRNLNIDTNEGIIDFLGELTGIGGYAQAASASHAVDLAPGTVLDLDALITAKRAAGRPKDIRAAEDLEVIRNRRDPELPFT